MRSFLRPAVLVLLALPLTGGTALGQSEPDASVRSTAEFGRAVGPALELLTKTQQKWHGSLGITLSKSGNATGLPSDSGRRYAATAGGTAIEDRLWFFGSAERSTRFDSLQFVPALPATDPAATRALAARLDSQFGARQTLSASFAQFRSGSALLTPLPATPLATSGLSLRYTAAVSSNMFFSANVSQRAVKGTAAAPIPGQ